MLNIEIEKMLNIMKERLLKLGFSAESVNDKIFYTISKNIYYYVSFVAELNSFVVEAGTKADAEKNVLIDAALFSVSLEPQKLIGEIEDWFIEYCIDRGEQNIL